MQLIRSSSNLLLSYLEENMPVTVKIKAEIHSLYPPVNSKHFNGKLEFQEHTEVIGYH